MSKNQVFMWIFTAFLVVGLMAVLLATVLVSVHP